MPTDRQASRPEPMQTPTPNKKQTSKPEDQQASRPEDKQASETLREAYKYVSWNVAARPSVTILEQWGETAWFVSYDGPYASNRPRHIRLRKDTCERWPSNVRNGSQFELFELHKKRRAVMWKVRQLFWVDGTPAPALLGGFHTSSKNGVTVRTRTSCDVGPPPLCMSRFIRPCVTLCHAFRPVRPCD